MTKILHTYGLPGIYLSICLSIYLSIYLKQLWVAKSKQFHYRQSLAHLPGEKRLRAEGSPGIGEGTGGIWMQCSELFMTGVICHQYFMLFIFEHANSKQCEWDFQVARKGPVENKRLNHCFFFRWPGLSMPPLFVSVWLRREVSARSCFAASFVGRFESQNQNPCGGVRFRTGSVPWAVGTIQWILEDSAVQRVCRSEKNRLHACVCVCACTCTIYGDNSKWGTLFSP